jgi:hypothetical protein
MFKNKNAIEKIFLKNEQAVVKVNIGRLVSRGLGTLSFSAPNLIDLTQYSYINK